MNVWLQAVHLIQFHLHIRTWNLSCQISLHNTLVIKNLNEAAHRISLLVPIPITEEQMDAYLDASFATYSGVPDMIEWLLSHGIFFMLNTSGTQGCFQSAYARNLIPAVPVVAANPVIRFPGIAGDVRYMYQVVETRHKPKNTESAMNVLCIHPSRAVIIGDSGGDPISSGVFQRGHS